MQKSTPGKFHDAHLPKMLSGDHYSDMQNACFDASLAHWKGRNSAAPASYCSVQHYNAVGKVADKLKAPKARVAVRPKARMIDPSVVEVNKACPCCPSCLALP